MHRPTLCTGMPSTCVQARGEDEFGLDGEGEEGGARSGGGLPWEGSDRDYTYEELLGERGAHPGADTPAPTREGGGAAVLFLFRRCHRPLVLRPQPAASELLSCPCPACTHGAWPASHKARHPLHPLPGPADRVFGILKAHNPELTGERRRTTLKPPQVGPRRRATHHPLQRRSSLPGERLNSSRLPASACSQAQPACAALGPDPLCAAGRAA